MCIGLQMVSRASRRLSSSLYYIEQLQYYLWYVLAFCIRFSLREERVLLEKVFGKYSIVFYCLLNESFDK